MTTPFRLSLADSALSHVEACEHIGAAAVYWSRGATLYRGDTLEDIPRPVADLPLPLYDQVLSLTRIGRRAGRLSFYNVAPLHDGVFFTFDRCVGILKGNRVQYLDGMKRPTRVLRGGLAVTPEGEVYFGEYVFNDARHEIHIYRWRPRADAVEIAYTFRAGAVRHIHSVQWDPFTERLLIATGDVDDECRILLATPDFNTIESLGRGDEDFRAVCPLPTVNAIYYGTDAQYRQNRLFRIARDGGTPLPLADVNGPVFYCARFGKWQLFATSAEMCPSQTSPYAILYAIGPDDNVFEVARWRKDALSRKLFQFGIINFPTIAPGVRPKRLPLSGVSLRGLDATVMWLESITPGESN